MANALQSAATSLTMSFLTAWRVGVESMLKVVSISVERIRPECRHNEMNHLEYLSAVVATLV